MNFAERFWIWHYASQRREIGYNLAEGGIGGYCGKEGQYKWSQSGGNAFSKRLKNDIDFAKRIGIKRSIIAIKLNYEKKIGWKKDIWKNRKHTKESKEKISKSQQGKQVGEKNSQYGTCWIYNLDLKINKKINKKDLENWIKNNWNLGRKIKF